MATDQETLLAAAKAALFQWDIPGPYVELISRSENMVYRVEAANGKMYALRIHRPGYHTLPELNAELAWTMALHDAGVKVPAAIRTRGGQGYAEVRLPGGVDTRQVGVVEWIDGRLLGTTMKPDTELKVVDEAYASVGRIAAAIHNQATSWDVPRGFQRHHFDADGFMGEAPFWGRFWENPAIDADNKALFLKARAAIHRILSDYPKSDDLYSMIHADLHQYNIMVTKHGLMAIDFDDAGFGWHQYDLAVALFADIGNPRFDQMQDALVAGYREIRPISDDALALLPMFLLIRSLVLLGWVDLRRDLDKSEYESMLIKQASAQSIEFLASAG